MRKIFDLFKKVFGVNVEQSIEANRTQNTTFTQTTTVFNFLLPAIILLLALFVLGVWGYNEYQKSKYNLSPMAVGTLNVVVAPFSNQTRGQCGASQDIGLLVADAFYSGLKSSAYDETSKVKPAFRSPREVPELEGETESQLTKSAEDLARQINSQIVIYGIITCTDIIQKPSAQIMFFVAPSSFSDAQELIGEFSFNSGVLYGNLNSGEEFLSSNQTLQDQTLQMKINVMSLVIHALGSFLGENYPEALNAISTANTSKLWGSEGGKEVVLIIAGNIEVRYAQQLSLMGQEEQALKEIKQAHDFYDQANNISIKEGKGEYARSLIGFAAVEHFYATYKSDVSCKYQDIDTTKFVSEENYLTRAESATNSPLTADVAVKTEFNKAQIGLTLYALHPKNVNLDDVEKKYNSVIKSYLNPDDPHHPNHRILEIAAHSYSGLAFVYWYKGDDTAVVTNFNLAIKTTETPSLQAGYLKSLGDYYYSKKNYTEAVKYYNATLDTNGNLPKCTANLQSTISDIEKLIAN
jgi:tetratricopeptide (TPR) repeat protein